MALSQTDLDRLETALASGRLTVEYDGRRVTYQSVTDLQAAIAYTKSVLAGQASGGRVSHSYATFSRN
jgi:hypothetical protein